MLAKKDRGRGADLQAAPLQFGANVVSDRIMGADLLQADLLQAAEGSDGEDGEDHGQEAAPVSGDEIDSDVELDSDAEPGSDAGNDSAAGSDVEELEGEVSASFATMLWVTTCMSEGLGPRFVDCIMHSRDVAPVVPSGCCPLAIYTLHWCLCLGTISAVSSSETSTPLLSYTTNQERRKQCR